MERIEAFFNENVVGACTRIAIAILILVIGLWLVKLLMKGLSKSKLFSKIEPSARGFITSAIGIVLRALVIITVANELGVPMASVVAVIGSAGVAVGLALQGGLSNIAGGIMILITRPFTVGDFVTAGGNSGTVETISIYYTTLVTPDNKKIVIPNGQITSATVTNFSAKETRRLDLDFTVAYSSDIDKVKKVLSAVAMSDERVLKEPEFAVLLTAYEDSAIKFTLRMWVNSADFWGVTFDTNEKVKKAFDMAGIEIPFPQLDVHLDK